MIFKPAPLTRFSCLVPGLRALARRDNCEFLWDGFLPAVCYGDRTERVSVEYLLELTDEHDWDGMADYVHEKCLSLPNIL